MHTPVLKINLGSLLENVKFYQSQIGKGKVLVMTKANAYGLGAKEVVGYLSKNGIEIFGFANPVEASKIRRSVLGDYRLVVVNSYFSEFNLNFFQEKRIEPSIIDGGDFSIVSQKSPQLNKPLGVHLKVNSGMNRFGIRANEAQESINFFKNHPNIIPLSIYSHLSESESNISFSLQQIEILNDFHRRISEGLGISIEKHICNSGGVTNLKNSHFDYVRIGIGAYGNTYNPKDKKYIRPVASLHGNISQIRHLKPNETTGYSRSGKMPNGGKIGLVNMGYGDGVFRCLGNGNAEVFVDGFRAKTIGNVSMDSFAIDLTGKEVARYAPVEIFGENIDVKEIAEKAGTISYEVLLKITSRVKKKYIQ